MINSLLYEGIISICILFLYFYIEPRFNKPNKNFLSMYNALRIIIALPFMEFILGFMLQSQNCSSNQFSFCIAKPDILSHSLFYDLFFLRTNDQPNGAHWIDYMFIPILFFVTFYLTKDAFFSALNVGFMVFMHEFLWFIGYWFAYYSVFKYEGFLNDISFFILVCTIGYVAFKKYFKYYKGPQFLIGIGAYILVLFVWLIKFHYAVTVINNTFVGNANQFFITQWYYLPAINEIEVFSWIVIFVTFLVNIIVYSKQKN